MSNIDAPSFETSKFDSGIARDARKIWQAGIDAVNGREAILRSVSLDDNELQVGNTRYPLDRTRVCIVGAGKATSAMTQSLLEVLDPWRKRANTDDASDVVFGQINVPNGQGFSDRSLKVCQVRPLAVNLPTSQAVAATSEMVSLLNQLRPNDLCLFLVSGGGSALLCLPVDSVPLDDLIITTKRLAEIGADIVQINRVRQCLSRVKGGGLLANCNADNAHTLVISDIIGDPLEFIASGPTMIPKSSLARQANEALAELRQVDPSMKFPSSVLDHLAALASGSDDSDDTDNSVQADVGLPAHQIDVIANNELAVMAAFQRAKELGYKTSVFQPVSPERLPDIAIDLVAESSNTSAKHAVISGGEPVVKLCDSSVRGLGGRNQQLVLQAIVEFLQRNSIQDASQLVNLPRFCFLSGGSDGEDGTTPVAGGWCDHERLVRLLETDIDLQKELALNNAWSVFKSVDCLLETPAPTETNVCDLRVFLIDGTE